jgi:tRNA A-37 threonylcarbamoyl transferase component Bud32
VGRGALVVGALLLVGGGATLGYALTKGSPDAAMTPEQTAAMATMVERLSGEIREVHVAAKTKVTTFVQSRKQLGNALPSRDMETLTDLVYGMKGGEGKIDLAPGEMLEVGYVDGAKFEPLVIQPKDAKSSGVGGKPASYAKLMGDQLMVLEVVEVKADNGNVTGYATFGAPKPLKPVFDALVAAGVTGRFELGSETREIGVIPPGAETATMALSEPDARLVVAAPAAAGKPLPLIGVGAGVAGLGLILVLVGMITRKKPTAQNDSQAWPTQPSGANRATQLTGNVAAGTPTPTGMTGAAGSLSFNPGDLGPGAMIGRWEVIRRLGSGGMADVYLAHSKGEAGFEKRVAIKVMHPHLARNERAVEHFLDEARLASRINHPNIVQILDLGKIGNDYVIVMEYVEGVDLERMLASARVTSRLVPVDVGLGILCRICDGLHAAHTALASDGTPLGIIHRDVKAANVLVSKQGGVKVVDFGIAKAATQAHLTVAGETKGTPSMMAPEQRVGERVDVRADVYSVAAVGYEILTGHGVNLDLAALAHLGVENWPHLPPPSTLRSDLPPELDGLLLGAMAFEREKRPESCGAYEAMLEQMMKKYGIAATDKDIARWVDSELRQLVPSLEGAGAASMLNERPLTT